MDSQEARRLLERGSSTGTAFAVERTSRPALAEALSALANASGGTLLLGVTQAGSVRGVRDTEAVCRKVLSAALQISPPLILPVPAPVRVGDHALVAVHVPRGLPHVYAIDGHYLVRDGRQTRPLEAPEIHRLMLQRGLIRFETQVPDGATVDDLDWDRVRQYTNRLEQLGQITAEQALKQRACLIQQHDGPKPTHAGLLLFGQNPSRWIPNAEITAVRYLGPEMSDEFIREDIGGPLPDQILKAEAFLRANTSQDIKLEGLAHTERAAYPGDVLREVIVNAVAHRDYTVQGESIRALIFAGRIEVYSPGRLPGHVTVENIVDERFSRNPVIVQVLADMGYIEKLGYGIDRMLRSLQDAGQSAPRFEETVAGFQVSLYARPRAQTPQQKRWAQLNVNPRQQQAVHYVAQHGRITNREYQKLCPDVSAETIRRDLSDLVHQDILLRIGRKRATYYIVKGAKRDN